jgi:phosphate/sulfate permease
MKRIHEMTLAVALMSAMTPGFSFGAADIADTDATATATRSMQNGIAYITGGVGVDEADALRSVAHQ